MLVSGEVKSMAELARLGRVSRARITQIMDLLLLAPEIQEKILTAASSPPLRSLLKICQNPVWVDQRRSWIRIIGGKIA
jgi:hypothetical protein